MIQTAERINVRNLTVDIPRRELFDISDYVTEEDWSNMHKQFFYSTDVKNRAKIAVAMKYMNPGLYRTLMPDKFQLQVMNKLGRLNHNNLRWPEFMELIVLAKLLYPQRITSYLERRKPGLATEIRTEMNGSQPSTLENLGMAGELYLLFGRSTSIPGSYHRDKLLEKIERERGTHLLESSDFFYLRMLFPAHPIELSDEKLSSIVGAIQRTRAAGEFIMLAKLVFNLKVSLATRVAVTEDGLELEGHAARRQQLLTVPEIRRF